MKNHVVRFGVLTSMLALALTAFAGSKQKIKPKELIEKHRQSIGSPQALAEVKSIMAAGTSSAIFKGRGKGLTEGIAVIASQGNRNMMGMKFNNPEHQFEKMGFDGTNLSVGFTSPGKRSVLGGFLRVNEKTFKRGLLGGALTTSWELLNYDEKVGKLKYRGKTKVDKRPAYKFGYNLRKGSDLNITFFFDAETFRHVKTEYTRVFSSGIGRVRGNNQSAARVDNSAQQSETRHKMTEKFDDFKPIGKLTLPHTYEIFLEIQTGNGATKDHFTMKLEQFRFNQEFKDGDFRVA